MDRPLKETVYSPDSELLNLGELLRGMGTNLLASRDLAWRSFDRNISAEHLNPALDPGDTEESFATRN